MNNTYIIAKENGRNRVSINLRLSICSYMEDRLKEPVNNCAQLTFTK